MLLEVIKYSIIYSLFLAFTLNYEYIATPDYKYLCLVFIIIIFITDTIIMKLIHDNFNKVNDDLVDEMNKFIEDDD